jgi:hypothetical protein
MKDLFHKLTNLVDHERFKILGLIVAIAIFAGLQGCDIKMTSPISHQQVTAQEWQAEKEQAVADVNALFANVQVKKAKFEAELAGDIASANAKAAGLNSAFKVGDSAMQAKIEQRQQFFQIAGGIGQAIIAGTLDPASIFGSLLTLLGVGLGVGGVADGLRKNSVIAELKANGSKNGSTS